MLVEVNSELAQVRGHLSFKLFCSPASATAEAYKFRMLQSVCVYGALVLGYWVWGTFEGKIMDKSMAKLIAILQVNTYYLLHTICKLPCPLGEAKDNL